MESLQGRLLVAAPHIHDPNFARAVVLVIEHGPHRAFGLILNDRSRNRRESAKRRAQPRHDHGQRHVNWGGPVAGPLMALHTRESVAEMEILPGLHFSVRQEYLDELLGQDEHAYRLFIGYAGWGAGQLDQQCEKGVWHVLPATAEDVFSLRSDQWEYLSGQIGRSFLRLVLHVDYVPEDPLLN